MNAFSNANEARDYAREKINAGLVALNNIFASRRTVFRVFFFPEGPLAPVQGGAEGNTEYHIRIRNTFDNIWPCLKQQCDIIFVLTNSGRGGFGYDVVARLKLQNLGNPRNVAHEIGHVIGLMHLTGENCGKHCDNQSTATFMCDPPGAVAFSSCDIQRLPTHVYTAANCNRWKDFVEALPDSYACSIQPSISVSSSLPYLIQGCIPDRSEPEFTITIRGGQGGTNGVKVRAEFAELLYDLLEMMDFNTMVPKGASLTELQIREAGVEQIFNLNEGETREFRFKLKYNPPVNYNPDVSTGALVRAHLVLPDNTSITSEVSPQPYVTRSGNHGHLPQNRPVFVSGELVLQSNTSATTQTPSILVGPGGSIRIMSKWEFSAPTTGISPVIEGCSTMWQGITVAGNNSLTLKNITIKDAHEAVNLQTDGSSLVAEDTRFVNNNFGIRSSASGKNIVVRGCSFGTDDQGLRPSYPGQPLQPFFLGFAGIYLSLSSTSNPRTLTLDASPNTQAPNYFQNLRMGILAENAVLMVRNTVFEDILSANKPSGYPGPTQLGQAIFARNSIFRVSGNANSIVSLLNTTMGIWSERSTITATGCFMRGVGTGIRVANGPTHGYYLADNDIEATAQGIFVSQQSGTPAASCIVRNTITVSGPVSHGILLLNNKNLGNHTTFVYDNAIRLEGGLAAIRLASCARTQVLDNFIRLGNLDGPDRYGIRISGGEYNNVSCNNVLGPGRAGIRGEMDNSTDFLCNTINTSNHGLWLDGVFTGAKSNIFVGGNRFVDNALAGLLLGPNTLIGLQPHRGNRWFNTDGPTRAIHQGGSLLVIESRFTVDSNEDPAYLPDEVVPQPWFSDVVTPEPSFDCPLVMPCAPPMFTGGEGEELDRRTATGTLVGFEHPGHSLWLAQKRLYERLAREGNPYVGDADFEAFLSSAPTSSAGRFAGVQMGIREAFVLAETEWQAIDSAETAIIQALELLTDTETQQMAANLSPQDSAELAAVRADVLSQLVQRTTFLSDLRSAIEADRAAAATHILAQNATLTAQASYEVNEKTVNAIYLQTVAQGATELTWQQRSDLEAIAMQCPMADGEAVLQARALLTAWEDATALDAYDDALCAARRFVTTGAPSSAKRLWVYPNPTSEVLYVRCETPTDSQHFFLYNTTGQVVLSHTLALSENRINIGHLPEGLYYYWIDKEHRGKVVIRR